MDAWVKIIQQQMQRNNLKSSAPITDQGLYQTAAVMEAQNQLPTDVQTILNFA